MSSAAVAALLLSCSVSAAASAREDAYTTKFDDVDVDVILSNGRLYRSYFECVAAEEGKARCTPDAQVLRSNIPDALRNDCGKCSDKQKEKLKKVVAFMIKNRPNDWKILTAKFDHTGVYTKKHGDKLKNL